MFSAGVGVGSWSRFFKIAGVGVRSRSRVFKNAGVGVGFLKLLESESGVGVGFSKLLESESGVGILKNLPTPQPWLKTWNHAAIFSFSCLFCLFYYANPELINHLCQELPCLVKCCSHGCQSHRASSVLQVIHLGSLTPNTEDFPWFKGTSCVLCAFSHSPNMSPSYFTASSNIHSKKYFYLLKYMHFLLT